MPFNSFLREIGHGLLFLVVQVIFLKQLVLFGYAFLLLYPLFILLLPIRRKSLSLLLISFLYGLLLDAFYDTGGMHTAALLTLALARNLWLEALTPTGGYADIERPHALNMGVGWFILYATPLLLLHHLIFFGLDSLGLGNWGLMALKTGSSLLLALGASLVVQLLFYSKKRAL
ncbi:MAG: rod shape-determining protein MreD [Nitritalea sp.]